MSRSIWYYIKNYRFNSLFIKNFIIIILLVVIPLLGLSFGVYSYYGEILRDEIAVANESSLLRVKDMVDMIFNEAEKLSVRMASDPGVSKFMTLQQQYDFATIEMFKEALSTISLSTGEYVHSIYVYSANKDYVMSSIDGGKSLSMFNDNTWINEYSKIGSLAVISMLPRKIESADKYPLQVLSFLLTTPLNGVNKNGAVVVNVDLQRLNQLIINVGKSRTENLYIIDDNDIILFNNNVDYIGKAAGDIPGLSRILYEGDNLSNIVEMDGAQHVVTSVGSNSEKWRYLSLIPLRQYEYKIKNLEKIMLALSALCVFIAVLVAFFISIRVFTPIKDIMQLLENPEEYSTKRGNGEKKDSTSELKHIASNILNNFNRSKYMEEELASRMVMLKRARTLALQSQINPHFLYNTLQTINWLVIGLTDSENDASMVVTSLSNLLRATLDSDNYLITIKNEINYVKEYIEIQKIRYKDKFEVEWNVDNAIMDCLITQITLQPIFENCIYHGIKPKKEKGFIRVYGGLSEDRIIITVEDNGVGITEEELNKLNNELKEDYIQGSNHIGIRNVNQRIKLIFGETYGIYLNKNAPDGLRVEIVLPKVEKYESFSC